MGSTTSCFYLTLSLSWSLFTLCCSQLQTSQVGALLQIRKHLEYPYQLEIWNTQKFSICYLAPSLQMNVTCSNTALTELRIKGDKPSSKINTFFDGYPIPNQTLSEKFSIDSLFTTVSRLTDLKVLSLVSLGIWGRLPDKIQRLTSLQYLDLSSNFIFGTVPPTIQSMSTLTSLTLDRNFLNDTIPDWLVSSLSNLTVLSLTNNKLNGQFPSSLARNTALTSLALSNNQISGELPDLSGLTSLKVLDLAGNRFDSELPAALPAGLIIAFLSNTSLTGDVSNVFDQLYQLEHLDLSQNQLSGDLPVTLFSLPKVSYLNVASNSLTGSLPYKMSCGGNLGYVDISNNRLTGGVPGCFSKRFTKFFGNCLTVDVQHQHPKSYCTGGGGEGVGKRRSSSSVKRVVILLSVVGGILISMGVLAFTFLLTCRKYCPRGCSKQYLLHNQVKENSITTATPKLLANARLISQAKRVEGGIPACRIFTLEELNEGTNNFDTSSFLGEGSWGKMYKGRLKNGGTQVAIRCLSLSNKSSTVRNLNLRLDLLGKLRHPNLVCLLGYCIHNINGGGGNTNKDKVYLVYEYVPNGNLRAFLSDSGGGSPKALKWPERLTNLVDAAKAVHFLHTSVIPGFFNNRLKMHNILVDENGTAKISDYGLSVIANYNHHHHQKVGGSDLDSWKTKMLDDDIHGFGFILLESILGPSVSTTEDTHLLTELASLGSPEGRRRMVDPLVLATSSQESLSTVIAITNRCLSCDSTITRPSFEDVLWNLQYAAQVQSTTDDAPHPNLEGN